MMRLVKVGMLLVCGLALFGCPKSEEKKEESAGGGGGGDKIGVAECDDYMTKYSACLGKMPAASKAASETAFKAQKDAWKQAAATPAGKEGLKTGCKAALDSLDQNPMCK